MRCCELTVLQENALANARLLSRSLEATGWYQCVSDIHRKKGVFKYEKNAAEQEDSGDSSTYNAGLPVVAFRFSDDFKKSYPHVKQVAVSNLLRAKQYIIPSKSSMTFSLEQGTKALRSTASKEPDRTM